MRLLRYDVLAPLVAADHPALGYFVRRDLLGQAPEPIDELWDSPHALRVVGRQQPDGRWRYAGGDPAVRSADNYDQLETYRQLGVLKSRFFTRDTYPDHASASYWQIFSYPFWWTDLLSALDSLTTAGFGTNDPDIAAGLTWFIDHQQPNGLWNTGHNRPKGHDSDLWVALAICRLLGRAQLDP